MIQQHLGLEHAFSSEPLLSVWPAVRQYLQEYWKNPNHGDLPNWQAALERVGELVSEKHAGWRVEDDYLRLAPDVGSDKQSDLEAALQQLHPWRKGPVGIGPVDIDTEWRSDWKWQRLLPHIDFSGKRVLDVGAGNGYYGYRMLDAGAESVLGVDPTLLFVMQSRLMQQCAGHPNNWVLPMKLEQMPESVDGFDFVLSLGVLYHRKDPIEHLQKLKHCTATGGQIVVETFVIPPGIGESLEVDRYARMRNIYKIPSAKTLRNWFQKAGFDDVKAIDCCRTSAEEQRTTPWMQFESLPEALSKDNKKWTIEKHPSPMRMICCARRRS